MTDKQSTPEDGERRQLVANQLATTELHLTLTEQKVDVSNAIKLPLDHINELGMAFASLPSAFRTITTTVTTPTLLEATDKFGNPLNPSILQSFNDGSGLMGSYRDAATGFKQARLHVTDSQTISSVAQIPYDPTRLFMAAALAQVNQKLDSIQESVDEMFDYMRQRDKARMRGNLKALTDYLNGYGLNYGNTTSMISAHTDVLRIMRESAQDIDHFSSEAQKGLKRKGIAEMRGAVGKRLDKVLDYLRDCQLATYIHVFALFLEPMLAENFKPAKLVDVVAKIEKDSLKYRELYTKCYDVLEASTASSIDTALLNGLASAGKKLGQVIEATPVGDHTLIDEALETAGEDIGRFNSRQSEQLVLKLHQAKVPDTTSFTQSVKEINSLYNGPTRIAVDAENIYILPAEREDI